MIGFYGCSTKNVFFDEAKSLTTTQCSVAQITAANVAMAVVDIRPAASFTITVIGLDTMGGTTGWRVGTDGDELRGVRASLRGAQSGLMRFPIVAHACRPARPGARSQDPSRASRLHFLGPSGA